MDNYDLAPSPLPWATGLTQKANITPVLSRIHTPEPESHFSHIRTHLSLASEGGDEATVRLLLSQGADPNAKDIIGGRTPLSWAAGTGQEGVVTLLLEKGAAPNTKDRIGGRTPLSWAASNGTEGVVKRLLARGARTDTVSTARDTPLLLAVRGDHATVVQLILEVGNELNGEDIEHSQTVLCWAIKNGNVRGLKLMLEKGFKPDKKESKHCHHPIPLSLAAEGGCEEMVELLLDNGANGDAKDQFHRTPMWFAARNGQVAVVRVLLEKGNVDLNVKSEGGLTPRARAALEGHEEVVTILTDAGAETGTRMETDGSR